jgi:hypothetical protein
VLSRTCDTRCPSRCGLGLSSADERSSTEEPGARDLDLGARPLACGVSAGRAQRGCYRQGGAALVKRVATRERSCTGRRLPVRCAGFNRSDGRACGSYRLQKSTGGARPFAPASEELAVNLKGLAFACESMARRKRVGSRASMAKSRDRWRVFGACESGSRKHLPMEGALSREKLLSLTRG